VSLGSNGKNKLGRFRNKGSSVMNQEKYGDRSSHLKKKLGGVRPMSEEGYQSLLWEHFQGVDFGGGEDFSSLEDWEKAKRGQFMVERNNRFKFSLS